MENNAAFDQDKMKGYQQSVGKRSLEWNVSTIGIIGAATYITNAINGMLKDSGLTLSTISILSMLTENGGVLPQKDLVKDFPFPFTDQALTIALNNLEKLGYIKRSRMEGDKRTKLITLTDAGLDLAISANEYRKQAEACFTDIFDRKETEAFQKTLDKFCRFYQSPPWEETSAENSIFPY